MFRLFTLSCAPPQGVPPDTVWFDLLDPDDDACLAVAEATRLRVPARSEIVEIESSSRLRMEGEGIYLSMPVASPRSDGTRMLAPLGFVLSPRHLVTLRYTALPVFELYAKTVPAGASSAEIFIGLLEALVDRLADVLEHVGSELDTLSRRIFHAEGTGQRRPRNEDALLRATLRRIGGAGDLTSILRDSLLGIGRIVPYVGEHAGAWLPPEVKPRLLTVRQDIASLNDYDAQLTNKVQFLLDATLGFLNIEQNNGIKVLTVVSIVGIPPTLIASIYGMNFKNMPELNWAWGYPYGLSMILLSIVLPLLLFKWKRWL